MECVWEGERILCTKEVRRVCVCIEEEQWVVLVCRVCVVCCVALSLPSHHLVPPSSVKIDYVGYRGHVTDDKDKRLQRTH